jgi:hypothetical protein
MASAIVLAFDKHKEVVKKFSFSPTTIGPKMIVVCDCQSSLEGIMNSKVMKEYKTSHQTVNLCGLSSNFGIEINGNKKPKANNREKQSLLKEMRGWKSADEAIILHVDMIGEGIDVAGITAIMPFRNFGKIKFLQNIGRGTRLVKNDRERLYREEILPADLKSSDKGGKYVKPYCWLVLPVLSSDYKDTKERYAKYILTLRKDYGFDTSEMVVLTSGPGEDWPEGEKKKEKKTAFFGIVNIIEELDIIEEEIKIDEATHTLNTLTEEGLSELIMGLGK